MNVTASSSKDTTAVVVKLKEENTNEEQKNNAAVQKNFVLPPEYDENDSKWTLKYREPAPGLVELMPHTGVYVSADKLAECERLSNVCKRLARLLLTEIFTKSALTTCSWSGATANDSDIDGKQARPGLDEHATIILLKFVEEYGLTRDWIITDYQCILTYMRQIMLEMRCVGQKEEEEEDDDGELQEKSSHSHMRRKTLKVRRDIQKKIEDYDELLEEGSYSHMRQTMLEMRRDSQKEEDYDELLEEGSYSHMRQTMLDMRRDSQKEEDYDEHLEEDFHTRMYQIMLDIGRARLKENGDSCDEVLKKGSHTRKFILPPDYDENDSGCTFEYCKLREHSGVYINADKRDNCKKFLICQSFLTWIKRTCEKCIAAVCCMERCSKVKYK